MIRPLKKEFLHSARAGTVVPLSATLSTSTLSSLKIFNRLRSGHAAFFDEYTSQHKRYSYITTDPYLIFTSRNDSVELELPSTPTGKYGKRASMKRNPLKKLQDILANYRTALIPGCPPFQGGAVGFFLTGLNTCRETGSVVLRMSESRFIFVDAVVAMDHVENKMWVIVNPGAREQELGFRKPDPDIWEHYYDEAENRIHALVSRLESVQDDEANKLESMGASPDFTVLSCNEFKTMAGGCLQEPSFLHIFHSLPQGINRNDIAPCLEKLPMHSRAAYFAFEDMQFLSLFQNIPDQARLKDFNMQNKDAPGNTRNEETAVCCSPFGPVFGYYAHSGASDFRISEQAIFGNQQAAYFQIRTMSASQTTFEQGYADYMKKALLFRQLFQKG
ncbi:MAG: hypothetical protein WC539_09535 [Nitrospirota bacterium]